MQACVNTQKGHDEFFRKNGAEHGRLSQYGCLEHEVLLSRGQIIPKLIHRSLRAIPGHASIERGRKKTCVSNVLAPCASARDDSHSRQRPPKLMCFSKQRWRRKDRRCISSPLGTRASKGRGHFFLMRRPRELDSSLCVSPSVAPEGGIVPSTLLLLWVSLFMALTLRFL